MAAVAVLAFAALGIGPPDHSEGDPGSNGNNDHGLCTAYFAGSDEGQGNKRQAPPFEGLARAADDNGETVEEFCDDVGHPSENGNGNGNGN